MTTMGFPWRLALALLLMSAPVAHADPFTFTFELLPAGGDVVGEPGSTVGWGYTLTNDSDTDWLMLTELEHDPFVHAEPDTSLFLFPILAPGQTETVAYTYDPVTSNGLFEITWDRLAPLGTLNSGVFTLSAEFWDADPFDLESPGNFLAPAVAQTAAYTASVMTPVPEPGTLLLLASGLAAGFVRRRRAGPRTLEKR